MADYLGVLAASIAIVYKHNKAFIPEAVPRLWHQSIGQLIAAHYNPMLLGVFGVSSMGDQAEILRSCYGTVPPRV